MFKEVKATGLCINIMRKERHMYESKWTWKSWHIELLKWKILPDDINTLETAEEKISEHEQTTVQISSSDARRSWLKNNEEYLTDVWKILRG